ncbi:hypothetical protein [Gemmatimonas sp.]|uniref:hypothetical protein n=1 Tax=Gemmatimonas sp. TaxID=1962908 RepID=UPI00286B1A15|nr:hypothetical protein [Gemmatimonas sp.]
MSVNGINNTPLLPNLGATRAETARTQNGAERAQQATTNARASQNAALKPQTPIAGQSTTQSTVPAEAPAGTDPTLWSVLTNDERNFFAKTAALGPLTYSRIKAVTNPAPPTARGIRLDVRA